MYVISDTRVQVFTAEGKFLRTCAVLTNAAGIAVDSSGMVYVGESGLVFIFTPNGQLVRSFGERGIMD